MENHGVGWADRVFWAGLSLLMAMAARLIHLVLHCPCEQFAPLRPHHRHPPRASVVAKLPLVIVIIRHSNHQGLGKDKVYYSQVLEGAVACSRASQGDRGWRGRARV